MLVLVTTILALASLILMVAHPVGPVIVLLAVLPFDPMLWRAFGQLGNVLTWVPIVFFLFRARPANWGRIFLGTQIQQAVMLFTAVVFISHVIAIPDLGFFVLIPYGKKVTLAAIAAVVAWSLRDGKLILTPVRLLSLSMTAYMVFAILDFYFGIQILPHSKSEWGELGALGVEQLGIVRFQGPLHSENRTANYLIAPLFLSIGWLVLTKGRLEKVVALGCIGILAISMIATVSRSALLGTSVGILILMPMAFGFGARQILGLGLVGGLLIAVVAAGSAFLGADTGVETRFSSEHLAGGLRNRFNRVFTGLEIWASSPLIGVGEHNFKNYSEEILAREGDFAGSGAHNTYIHMMAETGLLGTIPFMMILLFSLRRYLIPVKSVPDLEAWRPFFFCAFVAQLVMCWFGGYHWERLFWVCIGFAGALEFCSVPARAPANALQRESDDLPEMPTAQAGYPLERGL